MSNIIAICCGNWNVKNQKTVLQEVHQKALCRNFVMLGQPSWTHEQLDNYSHFKTLRLPTNNLFNGHEPPGLKNHLVKENNQLFEEDEASGMKIIEKSIIRTKKMKHLDSNYLGSRFSIRRSSAWSTSGFSKFL